MKENKQMIHEHKIPNKVKPKEIKEGPIHKNYGKTPEYITKMKIEAEVKKEIQKKLDDEYYASKDETYAEMLRRYESL